DDAHDDGSDPHARAEDLKYDEPGRKALVPLGNIREVVAGRGLGGTDRGSEDRRGGQSENRADEREDQGRLPQSRRLRRNRGPRCPGDTAWHPGRPGRTWRIGCAFVLFEAGARGGIDQRGVRTRTPRLLGRELI